MQEDFSTQLQGWQKNFLEKATTLEETAETSTNPEWNHEWAETLKDLSHTGKDFIEELDAQEEKESVPAAQESIRPSDSFMLGTRFSDIEEQELDPVWEKWIYRGKITGVIGEEGTGKSTLMSALAAIISAGRPGPDDGLTAPGAVIYISPEEDDEITVLNRLKVEGANLQNVVTLQDVLDEPFQLPTHIRLLEKAILHYKASLVVIDPINSCIARGHTLNTNTGARAIMAPLQKMLKEAQCGLVFINHFTKSNSARTNVRGANSYGLYAFLRIYCSLKVDEATGKVVLHEEKNNLNTGKPSDLFIEKLPGGKLFFSGAGQSADFARMTEQQRLSMGAQAILKVLDSAPLYRSPGGFPPP